MRNQPLNEVDNPITRSMFKVKPVSSKSIRKYILSLVPLVEDSIKILLPEKFALMFDGWTDSSTHFVALFATFLKDNEYYELLLACAPLVKEDDLGADQHLSFVKETLKLYGKSMDNVICYIGDNCPVNQRLSTISNTPLIGCYSHKLNLAVEEWITDQVKLTDAIKKVRDVMVQL